MCVCLHRMFNAFHANQQLAIKRLTDSVRPKPQIEEDFRPLNPMLSRVYISQSARDCRVATAKFLRRMCHTLNTLLHTPGVLIGFLSKISDLITFTLIPLVSWFVLVLISAIGSSMMMILIATAEFGSNFTSTPDNLAAKLAKQRHPDEPRIESGGGLNNPLVPLSFSHLSDAVGKSLLWYTLPLFHI